MLILIFAGCAVQTKMPAKPCPGKITADEAIAALNDRREKIAPIRASGQCLFLYYLNDKQHKENFPVKIWVNPPAEMYLQGDIAFDATGMVLGSNADEFWFWLKPKEISSFWWGKWSQAGQWESFALSPQVLLEAFGAVDIPVGDWSLTHGRYDILWLHNDEGVLLKRVFIEPCDYVVAKIEYFDSAGRISATAELSGYKKLAEGFFVPAAIKVIAPAGDGKVNLALFSLASVNPAQLNEQQQQRLFVRPAPRGFEHIYQIVNGKAIEQTNK
jgi:hypothetical protein